MIYLPKYNTLLRSASNELVTASTDLHIDVCNGFTAFNLRFLQQRWRLLSSRRRFVVHSVTRHFFGSVDVFFHDRLRFSERICSSFLLFDVWIALLVVFCILFGGTCFLFALLDYLWHMCVLDRTRFRQLSLVLQALTLLNYSASVRLRCIKLWYIRLVSCTDIEAMVNNHHFAVCFLQVTAFFDEVISCNPSMLMKPGLLAFEDAVNMLVRKT